MEIWKEVKDYEGIYEVSNNGIIRSLDRCVGKRNYFVKGRIMKQHILDTGYSSTGLSKDSITTTRLIHQIVAESFLNHNRCGFEFVVNHIDFNKLNNSVDNLEVVTQRENANRKHLKSSSTYTGVVFNKVRKNWTSTISVGKKNYYLGTFSSELEASICYNEQLRLIEKGEKLDIKKPKFSSKYKGVFWNKANEKWCSQITINKKIIYLGLYKSELEAYNVCQKKLNNI
jgi:hypothetical protein